MANEKNILNFSTRSSKKCLSAQRASISGYIRLKIQQLADKTNGKISPKNRREGGGTKKKTASKLGENPRTKEIALANLTNEK